MRQWFRDDLRDTVRDRLLSRHGGAHRLFNSEFVGGMVQEHERGGWDWSVQLWALLMFHVWFKRHGPST